MAMPILLLLPLPFKELSKSSGINSKSLSYYSSLKIVVLYLCLGNACSYLGQTSVF